MDMALSSLSCSQTEYQGTGQDKKPDEGKKEVSLNHLRTPMGSEAVEGMQVCIRWAGSKFQTYLLCVK